jgi:drug/metabolite transporter (DMT)-like permease
MTDGGPRILEAKIGAGPVVPVGEGATSSLLLFAVPSFIWGTTWLAIKFQLGVVAPEVSVVWRFGLAALLLSGFCLVRGISLRFGLRDHLRFVALGVLLFGANYVLVYKSEEHLTSGLVAVLFAFMVFWNLLGARIFFGTPAPRAVVVGGVLGVTGVALLFWPEVAALRAGTVPGQAAGIALAVASTLLASGGNLYSQRLFSRGVGVLPATALGMGWSALLVAAGCALRGIPFTFDARPGYVLSLAYLALFGSVVAFVSYLTLVRRIGSGRSGYTAAVIPAIAMAVSTLFEGYRWTAGALVGMVLVLAGTVLVLRAKAAGTLPARPAVMAASAGEAAPATGRR